ncbi:MAG: hypothetical protein GX591_10055 [Planctomycetes bacterium]|nr:hypothetical protein [Planctomycetota bacterium]
MQRIMLILSAVCSLMLSAPATAELADPAALMPADATIFVAADLPVLKDRARRTLLWQLTEDPAMQAFMTSARETVQRKMREGRDEFAEELSIELPEEIPWPLGGAAAAMRVTTKEVTVEYPVYRPHEYSESPDEFASDLQFDEEDDDAGETRTYTYSVPVFDVVLVVDFGANVKDFQTLEQRVIDAALDQGLQRRRESYRDSDITILTPEDPDEDEPFGQLAAYAYRDTVLVIGNNVDWVRHVLGRMDGAAAPSLGEKEAFRAMVRSLGAGQIVACADLQRLIADLSEKARAEDPEVARYIRGLGADGLRYVGLAVDVAPDPVVQCRQTYRLTVEGPKRGLVKMLTPHARPIRVPAFTTRPMKSVTMIHYEPGELFDQANTIFSALGDMPLGMLAQQALAETGTEGRPPVSLRNDVLGQMTGPPVYRLGDAVDPERSPMGDVVFSVAARDAVALNEAIGRIHAAYAMGADSRRELMGSTLYLLGYEDFESPEASAVTIAGNALLSGPVAALEAAIMSLRGDEGRSLENDPLFRHARRHLPAEAGAWIYTDWRESLNGLWDALRSGAYDDMDDVYLRPAGEIVAALAVELLGEDVAFDRLPPFERVEKYFGAQTFHLVGTGEGLAAEGVILAPPAEQ